MNAEMVPIVPIMIHPTIEAITRVKKAPSFLPELKDVKK